MRAEALSRKEGYVGAVAFSRTGDPATGDFGDAKMIKKFGDEDFNEALNAMVKHWQARPVTVDSVRGPNIIVQSRGRAPAI
jgi:hypothetical protein